MNLRGEKQMQFTNPHPTCEVKFFQQSFFICALLVLSVMRMSGAESLDQSIDYLLKYIANSKVVFIRNGTEYTPAQGVDHVKAKYAHFKKQIKTPEDFIQLCASKSLLSKKPYLVRLADGKEMRLDAWLTQALKAHQAGAE